MKLIALLKCFSGEEFLEPCLKSIYKHVEKIIIVNSNISWTGNLGNRCKPVLDKLIEKGFDYQNKIIQLDCNTKNQKVQCEFGWNYIKHNLKCDYVMLVDTDEIWDNANIIRAKEYLINKPGFNAYRSRIYTYLKSIYYRVHPVEMLEPVVFLNAHLEHMGEQARGCSITPIFYMKDVFYHHFVFVRKNFDLVLEKLINSHSSEGQAVEPLDWWIGEKWNKIPEGNNFQPAIGYQHIWGSIKVIDNNELDIIFHTNKYEIVERFRAKQIYVACPWCKSLIYEMDMDIINKFFCKRCKWETTDEGSYDFIIKAKKNV